MLADGRDRDRISRRFRRLTDSATLHENGIDLSKLHKALISLEKELHTLNSSGQPTIHLTSTVQTHRHATL